jgi:hypothetical protein
LQWQKFNEENLQHIEARLREKLSRSGWTVTVYTGTHGVLRLNNNKNEPIEIYLMASKQRLPIPKIFFKIVIRGGSAGTKGAVFIGVNDPHSTIEEIRGIDDANLLCPDKSSEIRFNDWPCNERTDVGSGFIYSCRVSDFVRKLPELGLLHLAHVTEPLDISHSL